MNKQFSLGASAVPLKQDNPQLKTNNKRILSSNKRKPQGQQTQNKNTSGGPS